jgi:hypothetical protein
VKVEDERQAVVTLRVPEKVAVWLRKRAAEETIRRSVRVSVNSFVLELLAEAMAKEGGK